MKKSYPHTTTTLLEYAHNKVLLINALEISINMENAFPLKNNFLLLYTLAMMIRLLEILSKLESENLQTM
jgi:hypothetical protein